MPTNINTIIDELDPALRQKVEERAAALIAEEMALRKFPFARRLPHWCRRIITRFYRFG